MNKIVVRYVLSEHIRNQIRLKHLHMKNRIVEQFRLGEVFSYFVRVFKKNDPDKYPNSFNLRMMHGINRISIIMFLFCVLVMIYRAFTR